MAILIVILCLFILACLVMLSVMGRTDHPGLSNLKGHAYAQRGLHGNGVPENSMEAFRLAKENGYGVELDVHLLKDGNLAVFHDTDLYRMTGKAGQIVNLTADQLSEYLLTDTDQTIPLFQDVLNLFAGKVPLIVELKSVQNYHELCEKACKMLNGYGGVYCIESFDPRCIRWLRKNRPDLIRGQLSENYFRTTTAKLPWILKFLLSFQMMNFLTLPDFTAYRFNDRDHVSNGLVRGFWGVQGVSWTIKSQEDFDIAVKEGWIPIFEGFRP